MKSKDPRFIRWNELIDKLLTAPPTITLSPAAWAELKRLDDELRAAGVFPRLPHQAPAPAAVAVSVNEDR